jgi:hypothetical protein
MSKEEVKATNMFCKVAICTFAVVMGIFSIIYNPAHLFTSGIILAIGLECEPFKEEE